MVAFLLAAILSVPTGAPAPEPVPPAYPPDVVASVVAHQIVSYSRSVALSELVAYLADLEAQEAQRAAEAAAAEQARARPQVSNTGFHSDAWWRGVAVCEQGGENDPYFGYFSIMDGSAGGLDWSTQVAMANAILSREVASGRGESPAWAPSCVAAGYAASPGG